MCLIVLFCWLTPTAVGHAAESLTLAIQPVLSADKTKIVFAPLADYLGLVTGKKVIIETQPNFLSYWSVISKSPSYDLILDAAHFTDYRIKKLGYIVLAKIPEGVSYSIITHENNLLLDTNELIGKTVATLGSPSIGAARLDAMFPNTARQPAVVEVESTEKGVKMVVDGKVFAAIMPTPIVGREMIDGSPISVITTTQRLPHIALSVAPNVDVTTRETIRKALINAHNTESGKKMLKGTGFSKFDPADAKIYAGHSDLLKIYWGY